MGRKLRLSLRELDSLASCCVGFPLSSFSAVLAMTLQCSGTSRSVQNSGGVNAFHSPFFLAYFILAS